jgi:4-hydroxybenzoate polyprenyltransferase
VRSSALSLGERAPLVVQLCYGGSALTLAGAAMLQGLAFRPGFAFLWSLATYGMQVEAIQLRRPDLSRSSYGRHFSRQVLLGALLLLALIVGRGGPVPHA